MAKPVVIAAVARSRLMFMQLRVMRSRGHRNGATARCSPLPMRGVGAMAVRGLGAGYLYLCCGPCSFLYSALSIRSRKNALSINLMPVFATAGMPASLWK